MGNFFEHKPNRERRLTKIGQGLRAYVRNLAVWPRSKSRQDKAGFWPGEQKITSRSRLGPEGPPGKRPYFWPEESSYPGYTGPAGKRASLETNKTGRLPYPLLVIALSCLLTLCLALASQDSDKRFSPEEEFIDLSREMRANQPSVSSFADQSSKACAVDNSAPSPLNPAVEQVTNSGTNRANGQTEHWENQQSEEPALPLYISGAVARPGVYFLPSGSLVIDLVKQAGGFLEADPAADLNLAAPLLAHAHVHIAGAAEREEGVKSRVSYDSNLEANLASPGFKELTNPSGAWGQQQAGSLISLNHSSQADWEKIPGVGPKTAQAILRVREELGREMQLEDLLTVPGIKEKRFEQIKNYISLP